jgi:hypothetical protein
MSDSLTMPAIGIRAKHFSPHFTSALSIAPKMGYVF